jgi:AcrR family transcriptional regulator
MSKGEETRQAILDEAARVASRVGLGGLTIGTLATQTQLSKSGLFAHFQSKEALQLQVVRHAASRFIDLVVRPALVTPRGEPRVRELLERWLDWEMSAFPGGCPLVAASTEFDDQDGVVRDQLVRFQLDWLDTIAQTFRSGIGEGHFRADADPVQFAYDLNGVMLAFHQASRLLHDPEAATRARHAFEALLAAARPPRRETAERGAPAAPDATP